MDVRRSASSAAAPGFAPPLVHDVLRSPGQPLDAGTRAELEPRFGHSFADVRVHADGRAAESAAAVSAHAYAVGRDIVFGAGRYAPASAEGRRLIAHELAHVVQQSAGGGAALQAKLEVGAVDAPEERAADAAAEAALRGADASVAGGAGPVLRRQGGGSGGSPPTPPGTGPTAAPPAAGLGATPCDPARQAQVDAARREASRRTGRALERTVGIGVPAIDSHRDPTGDQQIAARNLARRIFAADPDMARVGSVLSSMRMRLSLPSLAVRCADPADRYCRARPAYVAGAHPPIYLCPLFFAGPEASYEARVRTMIHEAAHLAGIGDAFSESYCGEFDCQLSCGDLTSADSWSHFVHCLSGGTPDVPIAPPPPRRPAAPARP
jgi:hypothetical protein